MNVGFSGEDRVRRDHDCRDAVAVVGADFETRKRGVEGVGGEDVEFRDAVLDYSGRLRL